MTTQEGNDGRSPRRALMGPISEAVRATGRLGTSASPRQQRSVPQQQIQEPTPMQTDSQQLDVGNTTVLPITSPTPASGISGLPFYQSNEVE